jgi:hypothetical protein
MPDVPYGAREILTATRSRAVELAAHLDALRADLERAGAVAPARADYRDGVGFPAAAAAALRSLGRHLEFPDPETPTP